MAKYQKIQDRLLTPEEIALYTDKSGQRLTQWDKDKANAIIDSLNAQEQGVQPTPASSATQGTYLNPSYGKVTQTPYTAPLQKSQPTGAPARTATVDPVKAKMGQPTLKPDKTLEENLQAAARAAEQPNIGAPATQPKVLTAEQIATQKKQAAEAAYREANPSLGQAGTNEYSNPKDPQSGLYEPITTKQLQKQVANNEIKIDNKGFAYLPSEDKDGKLKWSTQPAYKVTRDGVMPVKLGQNGIGGAVVGAFGGNPASAVANVINAVPAVMGMLDPVTGTILKLANTAINNGSSQSELRKTMEANPGNAGSAFFESLTKLPSDPMQLAINQAQGVATPTGSNPSEYDAQRAGGAITQAIGLSIFGGLGAARAGMYGFNALIAQTGISVVNNWNQLAPAVAAGDMTLAQGMGLTGAYALADAASIKLGNTVGAGIKTLANAPKYAPIIGELGTQAVTDYGTTLGISYAEMKTRGLTNDEAWKQANKIAAVTGVMSLSFGVAFTTAPMVMKKGYQALVGYKLAEADANGTDFVTIKSDELPEWSAGNAEGAEAHNVLKQTIDANGGEVTISTKQAEKIISPEVKAIVGALGTSAPSKPVTEGLTIGQSNTISNLLTGKNEKVGTEVIQKIVTELNTNGKAFEDGWVPTVIKQNYEAETFKATKPEEKPTAVETKAKIEYANDIVKAGEAIGITPEKLVAGEIIETPKTIEASFDNSVTNQINNTANPKKVPKAAKIVSAAELEYVKNDIIKNWEEVYGADAVPRMIDAYDISAGTTVDEGIMKAISVPIMENINGKKIKTTLEAIYEYNRIKMSQAATSSLELAIVEQTPPALISKHKAAKAPVVEQPAKPEALPTDNTAVAEPEFNLKNIESSIDDAKRQKSNLKDDLEEINQERLNVGSENTNYDNLLKQMDDYENLIWQADNKIKELETNYDEMFTNTVKIAIKDAGAKIDKHSYASTGTQYYECSYTNKVTDETIDFTIRVANHSQVYDADINIDYGLDSHNIDGDNVLNLKDRINKFVKKSITAPKAEEAAPEEVYAPTEDAMAAQAEAEAAKVVKKKKSKNSSDLTDAELEYINNASTEDINKFYFDKYKPQWIKEFREVQADDPNITWDEFAKDKIDDAYNKTVLGMNTTQSVAGMALMLPELLDSGDDDSNDPTEAGWKHIAFGMGAVALGVGTIKYIRYKAGVRARLMNEKLGYTIPKSTPEPEPSIYKSRAATNPELYYPGKTAFDVVDIAKKTSRVQDAVIPRSYYLINTDANIFENTTSIMRDHPQYKDIPAIADPRQLYVSKQMAIKESQPYVNAAHEAENRFKESLTTPIPGLTHNDKAAALFRYNQEMQSRQRDILRTKKITVDDVEYTGQDARNILLKNLNDPQNQLNMMKTATNSYANGIPNLTDNQATALLNINPIFLNWQKMLQYNDIRLSGKNLFGVGQEGFGKVKYDAEETIKRVRANKRRVTQELHDAKKRLTIEEDSDKKKIIKGEINLKKKEAYKLATEEKTAKTTLRNVNHLTALGDYTYLNITKTPSRDMNWRTVVNEVKFDPETGKYKNVGVWDNSPLKLVGFAKTEKAANAMAKEAIIAAGTYKDPITGQTHYPQWQGEDGNNTFLFSDGRTVTYRTFSIEDQARGAFSTRSQVRDMTFKILSNGTNGFDLNFVEGVAKLKKDMLKRLDDIADIPDGDDINAAIAGEIKQLNADIEFLANMVAEKDNVKFASDYVQKNLLQMMRPGLLTYKSYNYDPINYYTMTAKDITTGMFDVGNARTNSFQAGAINTAISNTAIDQLKWQNDMGINNNYTKFLKNKIDKNSPVNQAINEHTTLRKWSSASTSWLAMQYLAFNPASMVKNELAGSIAYALAENNYAASMTGSIYNLVKNLPKNQGKAIGEITKDLSFFNIKTKGEVADPFNRSFKDLYIPIKGESYTVPYYEVATSKQLYRMANDAIKLSNIYNEDPVAASEIQGAWKGIGQVSFIGMKTTEMHMRAFMAFTEMDKMMREMPYESSGYSTMKEYTDNIVTLASAKVEAANGRYNLYDLAPFVQDLTGNWLGHNALLLVKPAIQNSLNWIQAIRKTGMDIALADSPLEKRKLIFRDVSRLAGLIGQASLVGGIKAVPLVTEGLAIMAMYNISANDGKWTATQQTAIEKLELGVRGMLTEAGLTEEQIDKLKQAMYYGSYSTLVGANLSMNEGWASYFEPVTIKAMKTIFADLGKAGKSGNFVEAVGMTIYKRLVPTQLKRAILFGVEIANDKRYDNNFKEQGGELTNRELITDLLAGKTLDEVDDTDSMYKLLNATDTDAGKQEYWLGLIKSPGIKIENKGYLADFTDKSIAMQPELMRRTKLIQLAVYKADQAVTEYETVSRNEVRAWVDADLAKGDKSEIRAWANYGTIPNEVQGGSVQEKIDRAIKWSDEYYQSEISTAILQNEAAKGNVVFDGKKISPAEITFDMPDEVKNAPDALRGFEYFKYKLQSSTDKVKRGGTTKTKSTGGRATFNADGEYVEPKEYEYKEPNND